MFFTRASRTLNVGKEKLYEILGSKWNPCTLGIPGLMRVVLESLPWFLMKICQVVLLDFNIHGPERKLKKNNFRLKILETLSG